MVPEIQVPISHCILESRVKNKGSGKSVVTSVKSTVLSQILPFSDLELKTFDSGLNVNLYVTQQESLWFKKRIKKVISSNCNNSFYT